MSADTWNTSLTFCTTFIVNQAMKKLPNQKMLTKTPSSADVAAKKSEVLQGVKVPLVGDLLGRERLTGAKKTRAGCDFASDRFVQLVEVPAVWHAKQFFLSVSQYTRTKNLSFRPQFYGNTKMK